MKKLINTLILIFVLGGITFAMFRGVQNKKESNTTDGILKDISLENLERDRNDYIKAHIRYINRLKELNTQIKNISKTLEEKAKIAQTLSETGDKYKENNFLELAAQNYKMGLSVFPQDSELNYKLGVVMSNLGLFYKEQNIQYFTQAETLFNRALSLPPRMGRANYGLALLYVSCFENKVNFGSLEKALECINKYLLENSNMPDAYFLRARIFVDLNRIPEAISTYQIILNITHVGSTNYKSAQENIKSLAG